MYFKSESYSLSKFGVPFAHVVIKVHAFNMKLKAVVTMASGEEFELVNQWDSEEEFKQRVENVVNSKAKVY